MIASENITALFLSYNLEVKYNVGNFHFRFTLANRFKRSFFYGPGHDGWYTGRMNLKALIVSLKPQVIFFMLPGRDFERGTFLTKFDYSFANCLKVLYDTDSQQHVWPRCKFINRNRVDYLLLGNNFKYIDDHRKLIDVSCKVVWQPFGVDSGFFADRRVARRKDVLFLGSVRPNHYPDRLHLVGTMRRVFGKRFFSQAGTSINLLQYADLLNKHKVFVSAGDVSGGFFMKNLEAMSCGCLLISQYSPCFEKLGFIHGKHLLLWRTFKELVDLTKHYLENQEERKKIASEGREFITHNHTWDHRVNKLLVLLK